MMIGVPTIGVTVRGAGDRGDGERGSGVEVISVIGPGYWGSG